MNYKISELAEKTGVTKRTIHYYITKGLLLPPEGAGVSSLYNDEHVERILLIKKLQQDYLPLNKIREIITNGSYDSMKDNTKTGKKKENISKGATINDLKSRSQEKSINNHENNIVLDSDSQIYIKYNIANIFELHCTKDNAEKYSYIIGNVKKYVKKMLED